jgi:hypothetical protein
MENRKEIVLYSGLIAYFPKALREVAHISFMGSKQHHPDEPVHWDRAKSPEELDSMMRHLVDHAEGELFDTDGTRHLAKCAWRLLACLEKELEKV